MKRWIAGLLMVPVVAHAGFLTGNKLYSDMNSSDVANRMHALGFVIGVHDSFEDTTICSGDNVTAGQMRDVVRKYLEQNPAHRDMSAYVLTLIALSQAFPCASSNKSGKRL